MTDKSETHTIDKPAQEIVAAQPQGVRVVEPSEEGRFMNLISEMMRDKDADMTKLERLLALRDQDVAARAKRAFDEDFVIMKPELPLVVRLHDNVQTKSKYAKLDDINQVIDPILAKHGFATSAKVTGQTETAVTMLIELRHRAGHTETMSLTLPIDDKGSSGNANKTRLQGISSTIMYLRRIGVCALLNISTGDDKDGNSDQPGGQDTISVEQAAEIDKRLRAIGDDAIPRFLKWAKIEKLLDLAVKNYSAALKAIAHQEEETKTKKVKQ